jgi:D-beta-D-heptose 7-phosphate kinase/D-beta-D-heptose 1-phosphate adenosyltransferase
MIEIEKYKSGLCTRKCLIIGDSMLDEYISGQVERISPEAPVPIVRVSGSKYTLGGAANVAANVRALGANAILIGAIGNDADANVFLDLIENYGIEWNGIQSAFGVTTKKTRVTGNSHQLVRLDREAALELNSDDEAGIAEEYERRIQDADVVVISDYKKGVCTESVCRTVIETARKFGKRVLVDPKQSDWSRYEGAFLIKPNLKEFHEVAGTASADIVQTAKRLVSEHSIENVLVTCSQDGMILVSDTGFVDFETDAREVFDVSGAGDTVIAAIAAFVAAGAPLGEAVRISNVAAGIAVEKFGTYTVSIDEIESAPDRDTSKKLMSRRRVAEFVSQSKRRGMKIVFANGCFDILHTGHISLLEQAKRQGDVLIVGLNSDASVKRLKGESRPLNNEADRVKLISAFEIVDAVVIFGEDTPFELIREIAPDVLVKGADYALDRIAGADIVRENGGKVILVPLIREKSTTALIEKVKSETKEGQSL